MYKIDNRTAHTRATQLPQTVRNTNPRVSTSTGVNHTTNVSRPQLKSNQSRDKVLPNNSQVKAKKTQVEVQPRIPSVFNKIKSVTACKESLNSRTLNANVAQELKECKTILAETSKSLREFISVRDSFLVALQTKQAEFEKYKAFNDRTVDYDKIERKLNEALEQLAQKDTTMSVSKANVSEGLSKPVTAQTLPQTAKKVVRNTNVLKPGMYRIDNRTAHIRAPQLPQTVRNTNPHVSTSIGVNHTTNVSRPQLKSNQSRDKVLPNNSQVKAKKTQGEVHPRIPIVSNKMKSVTVCKDSLNSITLIANAICATCNKCLVHSNHFACVTKMLNDVHARTKKPTVVPISTKKPKSQANKSVATPHKIKVASKSTNQKPQSYFRMLYENTTKEWKWWIERKSPSRYKWVPKPKKQWVPKAKMQWVPKAKNDHVQKRIVQLILFIDDSGCMKHMTGNLKLLVYYVEGLNHNLFSVGQFCDADLEVAFMKSTCFVRDLQGNDLLLATPTQAWLWHRRLSHLNFDYIKLLSKKDIVIGLPKLKYVKDQLCSSCELSKAKKSSFKSKVVSSLNGRLNLLHMDLCGPMQSTSAPSTHINVHAEENNNDQAKEREQVQDDEFTNPFCALAQEEVESSSYNVDHPLEQVRGNPSRPVETRRQLAADLEMCMYALTVSTAEPKNIKEAKYTLEILHKHGMDKCQSIGTPMAMKPKLDTDLSGNPVDQTDYRSKIRSLMYLTSSRPDIVQA
nr:hypothetical protein [Tanacetum cinerariifolium]